MEINRNYFRAKFANAWKAATTALLASTLMFAVGCNSGGGSSLEKFLGDPKNNEPPQIKLTFDPPTYDFGPLLTTAASPLSKSVTVKNETGMLLHIASVAGTPSTHFTMSSETCTALTTGLAIGETCTFVVLFKPTAGGLHNFAVNFAFSPTAGGTELTGAVNFLGTGQLPANLQISDGPIYDFGAVVATASSDHSFNVTNAGDVPAVNMAPGGLAAPFSYKGGAYPGLGGTCANTIAAHATCTIVVTFNPATTGLQTATMAIGYDNGDTTTSVQRDMQGTGATPASIAISESPGYDYGTYAVGASADKTFTLNNSGGVPAATLTGSGLAVPFSFKGGNFPGQGGTCGASLGSGGSCTIVVTYAPVTPGGMVDAIDIGYFDGLSPQSVSRAVQGTAVPPANLTISDGPTYDYGTQVTTSSTDKTFTINNTGGFNASFINGAGLAAPFAFKGGTYPGTGGNCGINLGAGANCTIVVTYNPTAAGSYSDAIEISYVNGAASAMVSRAVQGLAVDPANITISNGPTYDFGTRPTGSTIDHTFTLTNAGGTAATTVSGMGLTPPFTYKGGSFPGTGGNCTANLNPAATCTVVVTFAPVTTGVQNSAITVQYGNGLTTVTSNRAVTGLAVGPAVLSMSDGPFYDYGTQPIGKSVDKTITLSNTGGFGASAIIASGLAAPFSFKGGTYPGTGGTCTATLAASVSCTMVITYQVAAAVPSADTLDVDYNDGVNPQITNRDFQGTGVTPASLAVSDGPTYDYGPIATGGVAEKTFTITNTGSFTASSMSGTGLAAPFTFKGGSYPGTGGSCASTLAGGNTCTVVVRFAPVTTGTQSDVLEMNYNDGVVAQMAPRTIQGVGTLPATLTISDGPTYNFGSIPYGATATKSFVVTNIGGVPASAMAGGGLAAPFNFLGGAYPGTGGDCATTLAASATCTIVVEYAPTIAGTLTDQIELNYNDTVTSQTALRDLTGTAVNPANLAISDGPTYNFNTVAVGGTKDATLTVTNSGQYVAASLTGSGLSAPFSFKGGTYPGTGGSCTTTLNASASCTIVLNYSPSSTGTQTATANVNYHNGASAQVASRALSGTGAAPGLITISDSPSYDYGIFAAGSSGDKTFTLTNAGGVPVTAMAGGGLSAPFSFKGGTYPGTGGTCVATLNAGDTCTVVVTYNPTVAGTLSSTIQINYNDGVGAQSSSRVVQGTAVNPAILGFSDGPTFDFGTVPNTGSAEKVFTITNSGNFTSSSMAGAGLAAPFTFKGGSYPGTGGTCGNNLAAGGTCTVIIVFNPTALGPQSGTAQLNYFNGASAQTASVGVQGTSAPPGSITISNGPTYNFGSWPNGAVREQTLTLTNSGGVPVSSMTGSGLSAPYSFKGGTYPGTGGSCAATLAVTATCTVVVQYSPVSIGTTSATMQIDYNNGLVAAVSTRDLAGTSVPPAVLAISDGATYDFNTVAVGGSAEKIFTVTNTGGYNASSLSGAGISAPFTFKNGSYPGTGGNCGTNLAVGASCTVVVTYAPTSTGLQTSTLQVTYNDGVNGQTASRPVQGTGASPALLTVSDGATYNFGSTPVGSTLDKTFTVTNAGGVTANSIAGAGLASPFNFKGGTFPGTGGNCSTTLAASATCTVVVTFAPLSVSTPTGQLDLNYFDGVNNQTSSRPVTGTGVAPANLAISDGPTYDFGTRANGSSTDATLTITNSGSWSATGMSGSGLSTPFSYKGGAYPGSGGTCTGSLANGGSCTVVITFAPTASGIHPSTVTIAYNNGASGQTASRNVQGTGAPPASLSMSDGPTFNFGTKATGSNTDKTITLTNSGGVPATSLVGTGLAAPYIFKNGTFPGTGGDCGTTLNAGSSCTMIVTFSPSATGVQADAIEINYNDGVTAQTATRNLTGTGALPASITISDGPTWDFGTIAVGGSADKTLTVQNIGGVPATSVSGGGLASPFTFKGGSFPGSGGSCTATLNASATCTIVVSFTPSVGGVQNDDVEISYNDGVAVQMTPRPLTGTAVTPASLVISDGATFDFGTVPATSSNDKVFTVTNSGSLNATSITGSGLTAPFSFKGGSYPGSGGNCGASLNGGATCTIIVTYNPSANGGHSSTIQLPYYDGASNQTATRPVQGTAAPPASLTLSGGPTYNFGNVANGGFKDVTITITNGGGVPATAMAGAGLTTPYTYKGGSYPGTAGTCTTSLAASGTCTIVVTYNPVTLGASSSQVQINYHNGLSAQMAPLNVQGTSVNPASLSFSDSPTYDYLTHATGSTTSKTFTITNTGDVTATAMAGAAISAPFAFKNGTYPGTGGNCSTTLNSSASCTIVVDYAPVSTGTQNATVTLNFHNGASAVSGSVNVTGTGANPAALTISDSPTYDFGTLASGGTADKTFTINNTGGVTASSMAGSGLSAPFSFKGGSYPGSGGNCAATLAAGATCSIVVNYNPTNINTHNATITISYNDEVTGQSSTRPISGTSVAPATITITDGPTFNFGLVANGATVDKSFTLTNTGSFQATAVAGGTLAAPYSFKGGSFPGVGGNCSTSLNAAATCTIVVSYSPTITGTYPSQVQINYNDGAGAQMSPRNITGTSAAPASLAVSETGTWDFGTRATGSVTEKSFTISNSGGVTATGLASTSLSAPYAYKGGTYPGSGASCTTTLAAGATCTVIVTYSPVSTGASSSSVNIAYNDGVTSQNAIRGVQGVGATPASLAISDPVTFDYGSIANGGIGEKVFTVTNSGGVPAASMAGTGLAAPFFFKGGSYPGTAGTCSTTLNPAATCTMVVTFNPTIAGLQSDTIELDYNDGVTAQQAARGVQGTGVTPAIITITDGPTYDFGSIVATASVDKTFTLTNAGSLTATTLSGTGLIAPFTFKGGTFPGTGGNCGNSLNAAASCTIVVTFNPSVTGSFSDAIEITYYDGANNQMSPRNVQGVGATPANLSISGGPTFSFGQLAQNGTVNATLTVTNGGGVPATGMSGGGLSAPFSFVGGTYPGGGTCGVTLAPAASCTIILNYNPTTIATHNGTVEINYTNGLTAAQSTRAVTGTAVAPALLAISDAGYDYGTRPTGGSFDKAFTITNNGDFTATSIAGAGLIAPFTFKNGTFPGTGGSCTASLNPTASCTIVVSFAPTVTGAQGDSIEINYYDGANNQQSTRAITGTGATPANLSLSDANPYDFGLKANGSSTDKSFTLSNSGGVAATSIAGSGLSAPFSFKGGTFPGTGGNCTTSLASAGSCTIVVTFNPGVSGIANNTMIIGYSNGVSPQSVTKDLTGTGTTPANLSMTDGPTYNFGLKANGSSTDKTITITNGGNFTATTITGTGLAAPYSFKGGAYPGGTGTCSTTLAPAATCTIQVTYAPSVTGTHNDTIEINYNDGAANQMSPRDLTATSAPPAAITVSDVGFDFGIRATGSTITKLFTVTNGGGVEATAISVAALSAPYSYAGGFPGTGGDCGTTLAAAATCTIVVTYAPVGTGVHNGALNFTYNDGVTPTQTTARAFTGTGAAPALLAVSETGTFDYGSVAVGGNSEHTFTVSNSGGVPAASVAGTGLAAPFSFKGGSFPGTGGSCTATLNAAANCTMIVVFTPSAGGVFNDVIEVDYNNGVSAVQATRGVQGTGVTPANLAISNGVTYDYGAVVATGSKDFTFTVTNSGDLGASVMTGAGLSAPFTYKGGSYPGTGGNCSTSLAGAGTTCTIVVTFAPSVTGPFSSTIQINYNNGVTSVNSQRGVQGTGATPASLTLSGGPTYNFGILAQNGNVDGTITITNGGGVPATSIGGSGLSAPYSFKGGVFPGGVGTCTATLAAGDSCTIQLTYAPTTIATHTATVDINYNNALTTVTSSRNLTGQAVAPALLAINNVGYDYGTRPTGGSTDATFTITNNGDYPASSLAGAGLSAPYSFKNGTFPGTGGTCTTSLNASASCTVVVTFAPVSTGAQGSTIQINYFDGANNQSSTRAITGTGAAPASLTLSDTDPYNFGTRANGSNTDKTFTLSNSGGVNATAVGGAGLSAPFTYKNGSFPGTGGNCTTSIAPAGSCTIVVTYSPTAAGAHTSTMTVGYNDGVAVQSISKVVNGTGALPALITVSNGPTYNYGLRANGSSTDFTFTITNAGNFTATAMAGTGLSAPYSFKGGPYPGVGGDCSTTLSAGATCTVVVTFAPTITGTHNATFAMGYNDGAGAQSTPRDLTGQSAAPAAFTISDAGYNFGTKATGSVSEKSFTITNTGGVQATGMSVAALSTPYAFKNGTYPGTGGDCGTTLASTATCTVVITYSPIGTGVHNSSIDFTFNDGVTASATSNRAITGTGAAPATITISETGTYNFGSIATGGNLDHTFTLQNTGGVPAASVAGTGLTAPFTFKGGSFPGTSGGNCTTTLAPGASCDIVVNFAPTVGGLQSDTIEIDYNNGVTAVQSTRGVQGTGVTPALLTISDATVYNYGPVVATGSKDYTFTVTNSGDMSATSVAGAGLSAPFSYKGGSFPGTGGDCPTTITGANTTCAIVVTFAPSVTGPFSSTIQLNYNNGVTNVNSQRGVQGTGATPANLTLSGGPTYNFGVLAQNGNVNGTITVQNTGGVPATGMSGTGLSAPYTFAGGTYPGGGTCAATLAAGASCTIILNYNPTTVAVHNGTVTMNYNDGLSPQTSSRNLTGEAVAPALLAISDVGYDFGTVPTGGTVEKLFTVNNSGAFTATSIAGATLSAPFAFKGGTFPGLGGDCSATLNAGSSCTIMVTFSPASTGAQNTTVQINYYNGSSNQNAQRAVTGTGAAPATLTLSDTNPFNFGTKATGSFTDKSITVTNTGGVPATAIGGSGLAAPFSFKNGSFPGTGGNCTTSLNASQSCTVVVTYNPGTNGAHTDDMDIAYSNGVSAQMVSKTLQGTGAAPALLAISNGSTYNYGLKANGSSTDFTFTITNNGGITAATMTGNGLSAPYSFKGGGYPGGAGTCSTTLAAGASCTVEVTFAPASTGTHNGTFAINYNDGAANQSSTRDVTGTSAPPAAFTISDAGFNFGTKATGSSTDKTFSVTNSGGVQATGISLAALAAPYTFKNGTYPGTGGDCGTTLNASATCTVVITYAPVGTGTHNGSLDFTFNDGVTASQTASRAFTATGASPATITISETGTWDYGSIATGGSSDKTFTLSNTGGVPATSVAGTGLAAPFTFKGGSYPGTGGATCGTTINAGANCTIIVTFAPTVGGLQSDAIDIGYNNGVSAQTSSRGVQGTGVTPANLTISDGATYNYGSVVATGSKDKVFTITNSGDQTANSMVFSGLTGAFNYKNGTFPGSGGTCGATLAGANTTCTVVITFNPSTTGAFSNTLTLDYNNGVVAQQTTRGMQGSGATAALLTISGGPTYNFGVLAQNASADVTLTVTNTGGVTANSLVGTGLSAPYSFKGGSYPGGLGTCTTQLAAGADCTIIVNYNPTTVATHNATVGIDYDNGLSTQSSTRALTGQAVAPASLAVSDPGYDYGTVATGSSRDKLFTITNSGSFTATVVGGSGLSGAFSFKGGTFPGLGGDCSNTLNASSSCTVMVTFSPSGTGAQNNTISIDYFNGSSSQSATRLISGTGAAPALLTLSDADPFGFGSRAVGSTTDKSFILTNTGGVTATGIGGSGLSAPYSFKGGSFPGTPGGDCGTSLAAAASCTIVVSYAPGTQALHSATMNIAYTNGVSGQLTSKGLTGTGAAPALLTVSDADPYDYGNTAVGGLKDHTFTITNTGGVTASSLNITGLGTPFIYKDGIYPGTGGNCSATLAAGTPCTVVVSFVPSGTGSASTTMNVGYNNGVSAQNSPRQMQGTGAAPATLTISETGTYAFGTVAQNSTTLKSFTVTNTGGVTALSMNGLGLSGAYSFDGGTYPGNLATCSTSLGAGLTCTVIVKYNPSTIATHTATLQMSYNDGVTAQTSNRPLTGTAVAAASLTINGGPTYNWGTIANGATLEHTFAMTNSGGFNASSIAGATLSAPYSYKDGVFPGTGGNCTSSLAPSNSCNIVVVFAPGASATHNLNLQVNYNDGAAATNTQRAMTGVSAAPANLTIGDGPTYNYSTVATTATKDHTFTVSNSGGVNATAIAGGGLAAPYSFKGGSFPGAGGSCADPIQPGVPCTIVVSFQPGSNTTFNDTIELGYNDGVNVQQATRDLTGVGASPASLAISDGPGYDYATVAVGATKDKSFTITNSGGVQATSLSVTGLAAPFNFKGTAYPGTGGDCGTTLNAGASCMIVVTFSPGSTGSPSDAIDVSYNDGAVTQNFSRNIQGTGANPALLTFSDAGFDFGNRANGGSTVKLFTLTNSGGVAATSLAGAGLSGPYSFTGGSFPGTGGGDCLSSLGAGATCQVSVTFSPTVTGTHNITLQATYNNGAASGQVANRAITGSSTSPATLSISDGATFDFGTKLTSTVTDKVFTVTNTGDFSASVMSGGGLSGAPFLFKTGAYPGQVGGCGTTLAPLASCSVTIQFAPGSAGTFNDTMAINYNNGASTTAATRPVTGIAITPVPPSAPQSPQVALVGFGSIQVSWTAGSLGSAPITFAVERSTSSGSGFAEVVNSLSTTSYSDSGVTAGTTYYYRIKASGPGGNATSSEVSGSAIATFNISSATPGDRNTTVVWTAATGATSYIVKYGTSPGTWPSVATLTGTSPQLITPLTAGQQYYFMVTAKNATGEVNAPLEFGTKPIALAVKLARGPSSESHCAIMTNGDLRCWGAGSYGKLGNGGEANYGDDDDEVGSLVQPAQFGSGRTVTKLFVGNYANHMCAMMDNGLVKCWGRNTFGQLGYGTTLAGDTTNRGQDAGSIGDNLGYINIGSKTVSKMALGENHTCMLTTADEVYCWGYNGYGQLGLNHANNVGTGANQMGNMLNPVNLGGQTPVDIVAGQNHTCALMNTGAVRCWGLNTSGQLGIGNIASPRDRVGNAANEMTTLAINVDLGTNIRASEITSTVTSVCARLIDDNVGNPLTNSIKCWGDGANGRTGHNDQVDTGTASGNIGDNLGITDLGSGVTAKKIQAGSAHVCVITNTDTLKCFGANTGGALGQATGAANHRGDAANEMGINLPTSDIGAFTVLDISMGDASSCAKLSNNQWKCWGKNTTFQLGNLDPTGNDIGDAAAEYGNVIPFMDAGLPTRTIAQSYSTRDVICHLRDDGTVVCFGSNNYGRMLVGTMANTGDDPDEMGQNMASVFLGTGRTAKDVTMGQFHTCVILDTNQVKCWGRNTNGRLGLEDTVHRNKLADLNTLPLVNLGSGRTAKQIQAGIAHTCALLDDNSVKCWGLNANGQLGQNSVTQIGAASGDMGNALAAINLGSGRTAKAIATGSSHSCAILDTDDIKCWGLNTSGQLGINTTTARGSNSTTLSMAGLITVNLGAGTTATSLVAGAAHTCAIVTGGYVKCWGAGGNGRLGSGSTTNRGTAAGANGMENLGVIDFGGKLANQITAGGAHNCVRFTDNSLKCFGAGGSGRTGHGNQTDLGGAASQTNAASTNTSIGSSRYPIEMTAVATSTCMIADDNQVRCFGNNTVGQLGIGNTNLIGDGANEMGDNLAITEPW